MRIKIIRILSRQVWRNKLTNSATGFLVVTCNILLIVALIAGYSNICSQQEASKKYSHEVRERWENQPDKHPHRMAHYGYVAFRQPYPLSFFDFGVDSYVGKSVFLEAHKQNTVIFSEVSLSGSLLRFGEITAGMIFQILLPLLIFFLGFDVISKERENGTLKLLLTQGINWGEVIIGKSIGLFSLALILVVPSLLIGLVLVVLIDSGNEGYRIYLRYGLLVAFYLMYFFVIALLTVLISAKSSNSRSSLTTMIVVWLIFILVFPRLAQFIGYNLYPTPSKIEFDTKVEQDLLQLGDSHNPNDPHFKHLKDSLLKLYNVDSVHQLPFNYSGFVMREGERLSSTAYAIHQHSLVKSYIEQQKLFKYMAAINPYMAIKNISMGLSGSDYRSFNDFHNQTEVFRYQLAQRMNELQMKHISNQSKGSAAKQSKISKDYWLQHPEFHHLFLTPRSVIESELISFASILLWLTVLFVCIKLFAHQLKAI
jgi:ABC-2 type transport system permease protein